MSLTRQCASTFAANDGHIFSAGSCVMTPSVTSGRLATASIMRDAFSERIGAANTTFGMGFLVTELVDEVRQHLSPPRPVVIHVLTPEIELVRNSLAVENVRDVPRCMRRFVRSLTTRDNYAAVMPKRLEWAARQSLQKPRR